MFSMKKIILTMFAGLLGFSYSGYAQQDPHYTQYMYNQSVVNPAYAGSKETLALGVLYRNQWTGLEGAPQTLTLFGHSRVGKKVGVGISAISDRLGPTEENNVYADFSYTLELGGRHKLALGVKAGMTMLQNNLRSKVSDFVPDPNDPMFAFDESSSFFNVGAGAFYYTDNYYIGLGVPNFLQNTYMTKNDRKFGSETMHMFLTGGYVFELDYQWKLRPSTMLKMATNSPLSVDLSVNAMWNNKLEFGVTYRLEDSFGGMVNYAVMPNLRIGYAYDYVTSDIRLAASGSHEVIVLFDIFYKRRVSSSPRYF